MVISSSVIQYFDSLRYRSWLYILLQYQQKIKECIPINNFLFMQPFLAFFLSKFQPAIKEFTQLDLSFLSRTQTKNRAR